ncbi:MAG TPA: ThiF family adenylyltransferase [Micropepsaceae bacterium]|nr:ThiF family adenylyltransferase [Micropepsaceae bacterium]
MPDKPSFKYEEAFKRNFGFLNRTEQDRLRKSRVAIAGLGGTGFVQVDALARLGVGAFNLADPDVYEMSNFNRQRGANMATIGRRKADVTKEVVAGIDPEADVRLFYDGIGPATVEPFLDGVDIVVDSLDFYCFQERFLLYRAARKRGLWVLTAPPLGFGFTLIIFDPKGMTFEDYFGFAPEDSLEDLTVSLVAGISPQPLFFQYLDRSGLSFGEKRLPSVSPAPVMLAGAIATEVMNLLTGKFPPLSAPTMFQFDALLHRYHQAEYRWNAETKNALRDQLRQFRAGS